MINIDVRRHCPRSPVIRAIPASTHGGAAGALHHVGSIALQHHLPSVAGARLYDPVGELSAAVTGLGALRRHLEKLKLVGCCAVGRNVGRGG